MAKRPPNKLCVVCGRKEIKPEGSNTEVWFFRRVPKCFKCVMLENEIIEEIKPGKRILIKSVKESEAAFPLRIFDKTKKELVGEFKKANDLRSRLNQYREANPRSKIMILDKKYHDFSDYFLL